MFQNETLVWELQKLLPFSFTLSMVLAEIGTQVLSQGGNLRKLIWEFSIEIANTGRRWAANFDYDCFLVPIALAC